MRYFLSAIFFLILIVNVNALEDEFKYCTDSSNFLQKKVICNGPGEYSVSKNQFCTTLPGAQNLESIFWYDDEIISECAPIMGLTNRDSKIAFCKKYATYDHTKKGCARLFGFSKAVIDDFNLIEYEKRNTNSYIASTASDAGIVYCQDGDGIVYKREYECDFGRGQWEISKKIYDDWIKRSERNLETTQIVTVPESKADTKIAHDNKYHRLNDVDYNYCLSGEGELRREKKPKYHELCSYNEGKLISHGSQIVHSIKSFCAQTPDNEYNRNDNICDQYLRYDTSSQTVTTQVVQVPKSKIDKEAPVLKIAERITVNEMDYSISGLVEDDSEVFIEADGNSIIVSDNKFQIKGSTPIGLNEIEVVAFDQWGNKISKNIIIERVIQTVESSNQFEELNPYKLKSKTSKNKLALVIGIEEYESIPNANFADRDAQFFVDYVQRGLGVPDNKIKFFFNENAKERSKFEMIKWFKQNITTDTEVYLYFSGHGLAINEGQELYLLANDTMTDFIEETAINRNEIFNAIAENNPKSVTAFLDTCYSGAGRADDQMLLAMAKGLVVVDEQQQKLPDNFTLFTAASAQESAWSLPEAQHGTFSYFLMKGMEGNADLNGDKKLTNGELRDYLLDNVGRYAQQQQTPQMVGDPNQVLIKF